MGNPEQKLCLIEPETSDLAVELQEEISLEDQLKGRMVELFDKFSGLALKAESIKAGKPAAELALKFYAEIVPKNETLVDTTTVFLEGVKFAVLRADIWRMYLDFCAKNSFLPMTKGSLYSRAEALDWKFPRKKDGFWAIPPGSGRKKLITR